MEQLCLKSFLDAGQHVKLFTYGTVENIPKGVEIADANDVLSMDTAIRHSRTGSPAPQADKFRYHMLAKHDDIIWADTDAYCVKPFTTESGHFHGWESEHHVNNGVLGLPPGSETLAALLEFTADEFAIPEWLPEPERRKLHEAKDAGTPVGVGDQQWGAWGPRALTWFLHKTGEVRYSLPRAALYPISFKERRIMLRPDAGAERFITPETLSIHFYGRRIRKRIQEAEGGVPHPDSLIGRLMAKHGISAEDGPLPAPPAPPAPLTPEDRRGRGALNLTDLADATGSDRGSRKHRYTELYQMLFHPLRQRKLSVVLLGLDGGLGVADPEGAGPVAEATLRMWLEYFPKAEFIAFDRAETAPFQDPRVTYVQTDFEKAPDFEAVSGAVDLVIDDATHASHHQQTAFAALFPKLAAAGLYVAEDLRFQPPPLERQGSVKTAALFQSYLETGIFDHPDGDVQAAFNDLRADISGCFLFPAQYIKGRRDQLLVVHKR